MTDYLEDKTMTIIFFILVIYRKIQNSYWFWNSYYKTICTSYEFEYNVFVYKIVIQLFNYYLAVSKTNKQTKPIKMMVVCKLMTAHNYKHDSSSPAPVHPLSDCPVDHHA